MPNTHSNYMQAKDRYGESVASAIWRAFRELHPDQSTARKAVVSETEHRILSHQPDAKTVRKIIAAIAERS